MYFQHNSEWFKDTTKCTSNRIVNDLNIQQNVLLTEQWMI